MMGEVISLLRNVESEKQMASGEAVCMQCNHKWVAVAEVGANRFECPECHTMKGLWMFEFSPADGELVRTCNCGNQLFLLTPEGHLCPNCGTYQMYD